ncbi:ND6 gene product (mitochondrion) [Siniperca chuatsi]|uniref:NADH-ubiquinone oxidoreductase chain 6 n=5 Tax=Siniperca TaxID=119487 RepID=G3LGT0_SINKN|nr:NADH dehydrogenase subunit 6 [Siniperca chuatsi]YP_004841900.1 NADH dehydrogenase subunit 6 [Siniperca knerii]YP_009058771.1 NADH dehydrogenase subunit 6 [Siniperca chuatsi x Siniperca scherzeri]YP_009143965.1 NADH dehydrogenase subunit 6 [Siniperca knerii x Siniperca chuatsi]AHH24994.1 NADH dehydrogenase subunit 6 [Siniperca undulata]AEH99420.1 NADH dehydrogenase subunit 6 [Siniperca chuatsi]AEM66207.1 NADH dehydrogenase subunit 6 [Siniperca knerii]AIM52438.1 NADH dehydrogenase subunit 6
MTYIMSLFLFGLVLGLVAVASNPSPYFAALGLVVVAGMGCGVLVGHGGPFLSLILFLIYLGGMLVVFAYSAALAAEPYPESWGSRPVAAYMLVYGIGVALVSGLFWGGWYEVSWVPVDELGEFTVLRGDTGGVALMYSLGGGMLVVSAWVLLLTLFVVLELTRGLSRGTLRAV